MKVLVNVAQGYLRGEVQAIQNANPSITKTDAIGRFANQRYGSWIKTNLSDDFNITDVRDNCFCVDFTYEDDANAFMRDVGGNALEA